MHTPTLVSPYERSESLVISGHMNSNTMDKFEKDLMKIFQEFCLSITVATNLIMVDFLDVTVDLKMGKYCIYRKPNCVHSQKLKLFPLPL